MSLTFAFELLKFLFTLFLLGIVREYVNFNLFVWLIMSYVVFYHAFPFSFPSFFLLSHPIFEKSDTQAIV